MLQDTQPKDYAQAIQYYENAIETKPDVKSHYWHLGLYFLLQGKEQEAQLTWLMGVGEVNEEENQDSIAELSQVLFQEIQKQLKSEKYQQAWIISQHLREVNPYHINNLLLNLYLSLEIELLNQEYFEQLNLTHVLQEIDISPDIEIFSQVLYKLIEFPSFHSLTLDFSKTILASLKNLNDFNYVMASVSVKLEYAFRNSHFAAQLLETYIDLDPDDRELLIRLAFCYQVTGQHFKGINTAKKLLSSSENLADKVFYNHLLIRGLLISAGAWEEACLAIEEQKTLILSLIKESLKIPENGVILRIYTSMYFFPCIVDTPQIIRPIQNKLMDLCLKNFELNLGEKINQYRYQEIYPKTSKKILKIGYLSHCLGQHSVGWISRWLFKYHNKDNFQIYSYIINPRVSDSLQQFFIEYSHQAHSIQSTGSILQLAEQIRQDEIDILVDLDSITIDLVCEVLVVKPAPIQVTWLGWDASGLPSIDYFIADPYVLPEESQTYYSEKIWRLPETYVAVDGFEVQTPTLRREQIDIPADGIIYFVGQKDYKRHLENTRLQLRIIKQVPNSYLLVKGFSDLAACQKFYETLAIEEGVDTKQLRFIGQDPNELIHRANLAIADIVLDTYPYNGATTTLETLWLGIPLVTRVGQQFAARNSYTMMINAGITEGIAWTDEEYVDWGVSLGKDEKLRQEVSWKLRQGRKNAPLWNAEKFTRDMEQAYQQMWQRYVDS
ncbi:O-linked N-acetylglucosamine transferase, SPINDLY family protein [uncultured Nostoc sp.]|uniref:O-linked N-acetylglucosamine transferase, SPINDLY family protein n=1 Tax=uncultured Nostoc sp. TaxID=340711 RepID=UPI00262C22D7|nr:O-linked N-acetylglucosamine transferase, SPINDLY family protein [uncultured Nostoc sp.]